MPPAWRDYAYAGIALPLPGRAASISCPHSYPLFYEALGLGEGHRFLEVGTGSGYGAALAREVTGRDGLVVSVEIDPVTLAFAAANLNRAGYSDVVRVLGDGALGHPALAPYDRICLTAACREPPASLLEQLGTGGRMILPVEHGTRQVLTLIEKRPDGLHRTRLCNVLYVGLQGPFGTPRLPQAPRPALIVTAKSLGAGRRALRRALPEATIKGTGFTAVLAVQADGDPVALAARASSFPGRALGRVVAVVAEVPSARVQMAEAVARWRPGRSGPASRCASACTSAVPTATLSPPRRWNARRGTRPGKLCQPSDGTPPAPTSSTPTSSFMSRSSDHGRWSASSGARPGWQTSKPGDQPHVHATCPCRPPPGCWVTVAGLPPTLQRALEEQGFDRSRTPAPRLAGQPPGAGPELRGVPGRTPSRPRSGAAPLYLQPFSHFSRVRAAA